MFGLVWECMIGASRRVVVGVSGGRVVSRWIHRFRGFDTRAKGQGGSFGPNHSWTAGVMKKRWSAIVHMHTTHRPNSKQPQHLWQKPTSYSSPLSFPVHPQSHPYIQRLSYPFRAKTPARTGPRARPGAGGGRPPSGHQRWEGRPECWAGRPPPTARGSPRRCPLYIVWVYV